jgi:hypothetical protein
MKASELQPALPSAVDNKGLGRPAAPLARDVSDDATRFAGYMQRAPDQPGVSLDEALGSLSSAAFGAEAPAAGTGMPAGGLPAPATAQTGAVPATPATPATRATPATHATAGEPAIAATRATPATPATTATPATPATPALRGRSPATPAVDPAASDSLPDTAAGAPSSSQTSAPVLTPAQFQARALKRKAIGLDGGLPGQAQLKQAQAAAAKAQRADAVRDKEPGVGAAAVAPALVPPPMQGAQPPATLPSAATTAVSGVAARAAGAEMPLAAIQSTAQIDQDDDMTADALDSSWEGPTDMAGAPPAPVRLEREQQLAEALGAQIQAQQVHLAVVNTPESLPLEVLKAL